MILGASFFLSSCVSKVPVEEYALAEVAVKSAQEVNAARHASGLWHEAEQAYQKGVQAFNKRNYGEAEELFVKARELAEEAELSARREMTKTGDFLL